jgi:hypothetical protein
VTHGLKRIQLERPRHGVNPPAFRAIAAALHAEYGKPDQTCIIPVLPAAGYRTPPLDGADPAAQWGVGEWKTPSCGPPSVRPAWAIIGFPLGIRRQASGALPASPQAGARGC